MTKNPYLSSKRLLFLTGLSIASAYTTSTFARPPAFKMPSAVVSGVQQAEQIAVKPRKKGRASYDLGLGKNSPINRYSDTYRQFESRRNQDYDVYQAVEYLLEHSAVVDFPSPLRANAAGPATTSTQNKKLSTPIVPTRFSDDMLTIVNSPHAKSNGVESLNDRPVAFSAHIRPQWDLNTPWVEMLIHEQKMKLTSAHSEVVQN